MPEQLQCSMRPLLSLPVVSSALWGAGQALSGSARRHTSLGQSPQPEGCSSGWYSLWWGGGARRRRWGWGDNQVVATVDALQKRKSIWNWTDGHFHPQGPSEGNSVQGHSLRVRRAGADRLFLFLNEINGHCRAFVKFWALQAKVTLASRRSLFGHPGAGHVHLHVQRVDSHEAASIYFLPC